MKWKENKFQFLIYFFTNWYIYKLDLSNLYVVCDTVTLCITGCNLFKPCDNTFCRTFYLFTLHASFQTICGNYFEKCLQLAGRILTTFVVTIISMEIFTLCCSFKQKRNEMNEVLGHPCAQICSTGPGESPEDGEMNEMTLPSRHRIRNSSPGCLRPSTLPLPHGGSPQYWIFTSERGRNILFLWNLKARVVFAPATFQAGSFNNCTRGLALHSNRLVAFILIEVPCVDYSNNLR